MLLRVNLLESIRRVELGCLICLICLISRALLGGAGRIGHAQGAVCRWLGLDATGLCALCVCLGLLNLGLGCDALRLTGDSGGCRRRSGYSFLCWARLGWQRLGGHDSISVGLDPIFNALQLASGRSGVRRLDCRRLVCLGCRPFLLNTLLRCRHRLARLARSPVLLEAHLLDCITRLDRRPVLFEAVLHGSRCLSRLSRSRSALELRLLGFPRDALLLVCSLFGDLDGRGLGLKALLLGGSSGCSGSLGRSGLFRLALLRGLGFDGLNRSCICLSLRCC